ncbi:hypothetical protein [Methylobrevis pamukkalensis]|nr:hypothetical protein [Methylobrevis pamukkalensis]
MTSIARLLAARRLAVGLGLSILLLPGAASAADEAAAPVIPYAQVAEKARVQTAVEILDAEAPLDLTGEARPAPAEALDRITPSADAAYWLTTAVLVAIVAALLWLFVRFGGASDLFRRGPHEARLHRAVRSETQTVDDAATSLSDLRAMADRPAALRIMLQRAMERAAEVHGMRLARSQTARGLLRRCRGPGCTTTACAPSSMRRNWCALPAATCRRARLRPVSSPPAPSSRPRRPDDGRRESRDEGPRLDRGHRDRCARRRARARCRAAARLDGPHPGGPLRHRLRRARRLAAQRGAGCPADA